MLQFNVMRWDINNDTIESYNIISKSLLDDIKKKRRNGKIIDYNTLKEYLKREFMYHYWSKAECEMIISGLYEKCDKIKVDMWTQIEMNLDLITKLIAEELKFRFSNTKSKKIIDKKESGKNND